MRAALAVQHSKPVNHTFRLIWSDPARQWVPVAEESGGRAIRTVLIGFLSCALGIAGPALAAPTGAQITAGSGSVTQTKTTTTVSQSSEALSLNWQSFNVAANETVNFVQPNASAIAVNRILRQNSGSEIFGHINANGQVWLINPNGILFGAGSQVNVGGLTASTLAVNDVTSGSNTRTFGGPGTGSVVNQGTITAAEGGYVALLGNQVLNGGLINAQLGHRGTGRGQCRNAHLQRTTTDSFESG